MKSFEKELFPICLLVDLFILNSCFVALHLCQLDNFLNGFAQYLMCFLHFNICWVITYIAFSKNIFLHKDFSNRIYRITKRMLIYILMIIVTTVLFLPKYFLMRYFIEFATIFYIGEIGSYFIIFKYLKYKRKIGLNTIRTAIISNSEQAIFLRRIMECNPMLGFKFLGFIVKDPVNTAQDTLGVTYNLVELIREHQIQMIFSILDADNQIFNQSLSAICDSNGVRLRFLMGQNHPFKLQKNINADVDIELLNPRVNPRDYVEVRIIKRLFDIFFSTFFILFVFTWLLPILALIIKLSSKGPVFFYQKRTGFNNKTFICIKFRTMRPNFLSDIKQATQHDNRITPLGLFLRNSHIDEFPQIFNVFYGQMSMIGPRPHMLKHTEQYSELIKHYLIRHYVKPGITGWAQVNGYCGETDELWKMEKRVEYDMFYVDNWSFYLDLQIMWHTVFKMKKIKMTSIKSDFKGTVSKENQILDDARVVSENVFSKI